MPVQSSFSSPRTLDLIIYPDGSTHISTQIDVDPFVTDFELDLFGSTIDNFVAVNEDGFLLNSNVIGNYTLIETFGSSVINIEYDIHDLVSKQGRVWTFSLDAPSDFTLLLPKNSAIVGMTNLPINMEIIDDHNKLTLSTGESEINYLLSTIPTISDTVDPVIPIDPTPQSDYLIYAIVGGVTVVAIIGLVVIVRIKQKTIKLIPDQHTIQKTKTTDVETTDVETTDVETTDVETTDVETTDVETTDVETIFKLKPDLREDDKEIVRFISNSEGEVFESELRKKFLQPRTTMWRAVKRLERNGIIEIEKKDLQNLVKLRKNIEEEK